MRSALNFLTRTKGGKRLSGADIITYLFLLLGTFIMFVPILWLVMSSFKTQAALVRFPPTFFPYRQATVTVEGYDEPRDLYNVTFEDATVQQLAQVARVGIEAQMVDPANPGEIIKVNINQRQPVEAISFSLDNYSRGIATFDFWTYLRN